jgi:hypothetical protein
MEAKKMNANQSDQKKVEEEQMEAARAAAQAIDGTFGAGTAWTLSGDVDKTVGHAAIETGDILGDPGTVAKGVGLEMYGTAEHIEGHLEHDFSAVQAEIEKAIAALKADFANLKAELTHATGEARTNVESKMDVAKAKQEGIKSRIQIELSQAQKNRDAKIAALQQQVDNADAQARADLAASIAQVRQEYKQEAEDLDKLFVEAEQALKQ